MFCNDPLLMYLKSFGYNVVRLPRTDIHPLQVTARQGKDLNRLGELATLLVSGSNIPLPALSENIRAANISGQRSSDLSIGIGLSILGSIISVMGGSMLGLDAKYQGAKTAAFEFQNVLEDRVDIIQLDQFLADADVNPLSRHVADLLEADELYVITAVIKSKQFTVEAHQSNGAGLELNVPQIQQLVGGAVKVSGAAEVTSKITYESKQSLVFGFQAVRLFYDQGRYTAFEPLTAGGLGLRSLSEVPDDGAQRLMEDSAFIRLT